MAQKTKRTVLLSPWFIGSVIILGMMGGVISEMLWRKSSQMVEPAVAQWATASPLVIKIVGGVKSVEAMRTHSNSSKDWSSGAWSGRQHYLIHGSIDTLDLLVYWKQEAGAGGVKIEKIEKIDSRRLVVIWP